MAKWCQWFGSCEGQRIANEREELANKVERDRKRKEKELDNKVERDLKGQEKELDEARRKIELSRSNLEEKDKELLALRNKLAGDIHEQRTAIEETRQRLKLENGTTKQLFLDEEIRNKIRDVEQKEIEVYCLKEEFGKREVDVEEKSERVEQEEKDLEAKLNTLHEKEESIKGLEKSLALKKEMDLKEGETTSRHDDGKGCSENVTGGTRKKRRHEVALVMRSYVLRGRTT